MKLFITGIGTDVGKTVASAIITQALEADYWKPIQAGDLHHSDADKVKALVSNKKSQFHPNAYALNTPASPHYAATLDGIVLDIKKIQEPTTTNHLVIEGAGGILVPLNDTDSIIDLIQKDHKVVVVSRHYLGSINHTLLTFEALKIGQRRAQLQRQLLVADASRAAPAFEAVVEGQVGHVAVDARLRHLACGQARGVGFPAVR